MAACEVVDMLHAVHIAVFGRIPIDDRSAVIDLAFLIGQDRADHRPRQFLGDASAIGDKVWLVQSIVVDCDDVVVFTGKSKGMTDALIDAAGPPEISISLLNDDFRIAGLEDVLSAICGAIIYNDDRKVLIGLCTQTVQTLRGQGDTVEDRNNDVKVSHKFPTRQISAAIPDTLRAGWSDWFLAPEIR